MKVILNGSKFAEITGSIHFSEQINVKATTSMGEVTLDVTTGSTLTGGLMFAERELARFGHRIAAIKSVRERTGLGLKDSKDLVDTVPTEEQYKVPQQARRVMPALTERCPLFIDDEPYRRCQRSEHHYGPCED